jgi:hypothetical protein
VRIGAGVRSRSIGWVVGFGLVDVPVRVLFGEASMEVGGRQGGRNGKCSVVVWTWWWVIEVGLSVGQWAMRLAYISSVRLKVGSGCDV